MKLKALLSHLRLALRGPAAGMELDERISQLTGLADPSRLYSALWESTTDAVIVIDQDNRIRHANRALREVLGYEPEEVVDQDIGMLQPPSVRQRHRAAMQRYLQTGQRTRDWRAFESTGLHREGHEVPLEISFSQVPTDRGALLAGFLRDVSARKQAEQALKLSEERLKLSMEAAGLGVWEWDIERDQLQGCPVARAALGIAVSRPVRFAALLARLHPADREQVEATVRRALQRPDGFRFEARVAGAAPGERWVMARGRAIGAAEGGATRMVGVLLDITERKAAERSRLEVEARLHEKQRLEAIGTLAGGIAHDFNNVLASILGNAAIALDELPAGHSLQESLEQIQRAGLRARDLVRQILAFSRRGPLNLVAQPLAPVVQETLTLLRATLPAAVRLQQRLPAEPVHALADATQVEQVLMNLCTNAWHALNGRAGTIVVGLDVAPPTVQREAPCAHLWVQDDGCGMDAALRDRIFEPFFTTKASGQGTGLGLAVVHGIVSAHNGFVRVDSEPGRGSTFHVYLPLALPSHDQPSGAARPLPPQRLPVPGRGEQVLYVDDDEVMVLMVERLLQRCGFRVCCVNSGDKAAALVRDQPDRFDAVVCDFNMPGLSGVDVARSIRGLRPGLPVVLSSGSLTAEVQQAAREAGVDVFLKKEDTFEALAPLLGALFQARAAGSSARVR
ncbi:MAG: PAS domain S-box protein [Pseudomonadota bacterium]